jgi:tetratricopeptide (TPR) repeat protein
MSHFVVGGTLRTDDPSYVRRQADDELYETLFEGEEYCSLFTSRQMGKSSLETRVRKRLEEEGFAVSMLDLTSLETTITWENFYKWIIRKIVRDFSLFNDSDLNLWLEENNRLNHTELLIRFFEDILLAKIDKKIIISLEEIDSVFSFNFPADDFFAWIRSCFNNRVNKKEYERLTFCLIGVATPSDLIKNRTKTPYNIGKEIELTNFTFEEAKRSLLPGLIDSVDFPEQVLQDIFQWTGGQPILTQKICRLVVKQEGRNPDVDRLVRDQIIENWEYCDRPQHLTYIRNRILSDRPLMREMLNIYTDILQTGAITIDNSYAQKQLLLSGLVVKDRNQIQVCNSIYRNVFHENWVNHQLDTVLDAETLRNELSELGIKLRDRGHQTFGDRVLKLVGLTVKFQDSSVERVVLLSYISSAYMELEIFHRAETEINLALDYLKNHPGFQNLRAEMEIVSQNLDKTRMDSLSQKSQALVYAYYNHASLYQRQGYLEDALQSYIVAFTILRDALEAELDILNEDVLPVEIVESIHKSLIELFADRQNIDFTIHDITHSLIQYLFLHYTPIEKLLDAKEWKKADEETYRMMTEKVGKQGIEMLVKSDFEKFQIEDLYVINALWERYSLGKFGFRKQAEVWLKSGGEIGKTKLAPLIEFWQAVGWISKGELPEIELNEVDYQLHAETPDGHLPTTGLRFQEVSLFSRFTNCDVAFFDGLR